MHPVIHQVRTGLLATLFVCAVAQSQPRWEYCGYRTVACIEASSDTIFVGTDKGLVLIDKKTQGIRALDRTNSPLPSNNIRSLARDHANRLWIGTNKGVVCYDDGVNVRPNSNGYIAFDRKGHLWVSEEVLGSVGVYDGSMWTDHLVGPNPGPIVVDSAGAVWVHSYYFSSPGPQPGLRVALKRFNGVSWDSVSVFGGIIRSMVADTNSILIANPSGVQRYDVTGWHPLTLPFPDPALARSLSFDSMHQLWVGCTDGRLFGSDSSGWKEVLPATSGEVATITFSRDTVFVGSGGDVVVLHGEERQLWAPSEYDFPPGRFDALTTNSRGKIWAAFNDRFRSLYVAGYALNSWGVDTISSLAGIGVYDMAVGGDDALWIASAGGGLVRVDHGIETQWKYPAAGIPTNYVFNVAVDRAGVVWCSTDKVSRFDGSTWTTYSSADGVFPANAARDIAIDSANNVWVSFPTHGIAKYDQQGHWSFRTLSDLGISSSMIMCLNAAPNGDLWVGSFTAGLLRIHNTAVTVFSTENSSIPSNQIYDITFGSDGTVWFTCSAGMTCFDGSVFSTFSPANAPMESIDYDAQIVADGAGNVWTNNAGGLLRYQFLVTTGVLDHPSGEGTPSALVLRGGYPNPFNPSTTIRYELPAPSHVKLSVLDLLGREVSVLVDERREAGVHEARFDAAGLSSGVYFCRMQSGGAVQTRKMILVR